MSVEFSLDFTYEDAKTPALTEVRGRVEPGKCVVLCGGSGCGKSTLLRCMNKLIPQFYEGNLRGFCRIGGRDLGELSVGETGRLASSVFQDPRSQFFTMNSSTELAFGLENFGVSHDKMVQRVEEAFRKFHLERLQNRDVFALSSGERQLVAILGAWAVDTDIFLLDEPTANLDFAAVEGLSRLLKQLKAQGKTMVLSEHRLYYLRGIADEYWYLQEGRILKKYPAEELESLPPEALAELGLRATDLDTLTPQPKAPPGDPVFRAENIRFSYGKKEKTLLNGVNLEMKKGEVLGLVGANGCGKTSFGKLAAGLLKLDSGSFYWEGRRMTPRQLRKNGIFIMQEAEFQFFTNSVLHELEYGLPDTAETRAEIKRLLQSVDLWKCRNQHPFSLSGGQMQKLVLLMACLSPKPLVILDEPTAGLDYRSLTACAQLIQTMQERKAVLIITHDPELMALVCHRCVSLRDGREFDPGTQAGLEELMAFLRRLPPEEDRKPRTSKPPVLDPRTGFLVFLLAMVAGIGTDSALIGLSFAAVVLVLLTQGRWRQALAGLGLMGAMYGAWAWLPGVVTAFLVSFFPRVVLIAFG